MLIIFTPESGERREWEFNPDEAWNFESELIESVGRPTWVSYETDYLELLRAGNTKAKHALLWVLLRRDDPRLRFVDLVFKANEVTLGIDKGERADLRQRLEAGEFDGAERAAVEDLLADYPDDQPEEVEPVVVGKDEPGDSATDSP